MASGLHLEELRFSKWEADVFFQGVFLFSFFSFFFSCKVKKNKKNSVCAVTKKKNH